MTIASTEEEHKVIITYPENLKLDLQPSESVTTINFEAVLPFLAFS